eukprot:Awhi_evm1s14506
MGTTLSVHTNPFRPLPNVQVEEGQCFKFDCNVDDLFIRTFMNLRTAFIFASFLWAISLCISFKALPPFLAKNRMFLLASSIFFSFPLPFIIVFILNEPETFTFGPNFLDLTAPNSSCRGSDVLIFFLSYLTMTVLLSVAAIMFYKKANASTNRNWKQSETMSFGRSSQHSSPVSTRSDADQILFDLIGEEALSGQEKVLSIKNKVEPKNDNHDDDEDDDFYLQSPEIKRNSANAHRENMEAIRNSLYKSHEKEKSAKTFAISCDKVLMCCITYQGFIALIGCVSFGFFLSDFERGTLSDESGFGFVYTCVFNLAGLVTALITLMADPKKAQRKSIRLSNYIDSAFL